MQLRNILCKILWLTLGVVSPQFLLAQTNELMIVEYVDWSSQNGVGVKLFNPTKKDIDLSTR